MPTTTTTISAYACALCGARAYASSHLCPTHAAQYAYLQAVAPLHSEGCTPAVAPHKYTALPGATMVGKRHCKGCNGTCTPNPYGELCAWQCGRLACQYSDLCPACGNTGAAAAQAV